MNVWLAETWSDVGLAYLKLIKQEGVDTAFIFNGKPLKDKWAPLEVEMTPGAVKDFISVGLVYGGLCCNDKALTCLGSLTGKIKHMAK